MKQILLVLAAWLLGSTAGAVQDAPGGGSFEVRYGGRAVDALPRELGPGAPMAASTWWPWAKENGYRLHLTEDGRVLVILPKKESGKKQLKLVGKVTAYFDEILPAPEREEPPAPAPPPPAEEGGEEGEDGEESWSFEWSDDGPPLDSETAVLIQARGVKEYESALRYAAERYPYLESWLNAGLHYAGFHLERPLAAVWVEEAEGLEEYDVENELVHRLTHLLTVRRFDQQPYWLTTGLAWHVESKLLKSIYCYPYRAEFVYETEHTSWEADLRAAHKGSTALRMDEVVGLRRGTFTIAEARNAWGAATFLARHHTDGLAPILEELRLLRDEKGIVRHGDGSWERVAGYEVSHVDQLAVLQRHAGESFLTELLAFYEKGKRYRPSSR
ncbi:MAG: hypothetical protein AAF682_00755 [Planctomycetota bacterium]